MLAIGFGFVFYLNGGLSNKADIKKISNAAFDVVPIKNYVESCIGDIGKEAVSLIGPHGGYINLPKYLAKDYFAETAYYFYIDRNLMPPKKLIERELSEYINQELFFCIKNFAEFKDKGFEIEQGDINAITSINPDNVLFTVGFPLKIRKGIIETNLESFSKSISGVRLGIIYDMSKDITDEQMKDFSSICLSCLINWSIEKDLHLDLQRLDNSTILFTITDNNTKISGLPYKDIYANRYPEISCRNIPANWPEEKINRFLLDCAKSQIESYHYRLKLNEIPDLKAVVDVPFGYNVKAAGANVTFSAYTNLFEINKTTGLSNFTPTEDEIGNYVIWINAVDSLGNEDFESFSLKVEEQ